MTGPTTFPDDLPAIAADDAVFDALAGGALAMTADDAVTLLAEWRDELDAAAGAAPLLAQLPQPPVRWTRTKRHGAAVAAITLALAASTGVAAAASGPRGPLGGLNRALFGQPSATAPKPDLIAERVTAMLDGIAVKVASARAAGGITDRDRGELDDALDTAASMLATDDNPPAALLTRIDALRGQVAELPTAATPSGVPTLTPSPDRHGSGSGDGSSGDGSNDTSGDSTGTQQSDGGSGDQSGSDGATGSGDVQQSSQPTQSSGDGGSDGGTSGDTATPTPTASAGSDGGSSDGSGSTDGGTGG